MYYCLFCSTESKPPYDLKMTWTDENDLYISWYHPNETNGVLSSFKIYINEARYDYKINSEDDYSLIYNYTIKSGLTLPDNYNVNVTACNLAGESEGIASIAGDSPPPIPEASVEHIDATEKSIKITFQSMKRYKKSFKQFLYVLITEGGGCQGQLNSYKDVLTEHHGTYHAVMPIGLIQVPQWKAVLVYNDMEANEYPRILELGENTTNNTVYTIKPKMNYSLGFIWINQLGRYIRANSKIISIATSYEGYEEGPAVESSTNIIILLIVIIAVLVITLVCKMVKIEIKKLLRCIHVFSNLEPEYINNEIIMGFIPPPMTEPICPGNPGFKTKQTRRIMMVDFQQYLQNELNEFDEQYKLFPQGPSKSWTYGTLPENKAKNRNSKLITYNHSRVVLNKINGDEYSDYINASYIDGYKIPRAYIATHDPQENTIYDFWRMIWQKRVTYIVMMANSNEEDQIKAEQYWPNRDEVAVFAEFTISFLKSETHANYKCRKFQLYYQQAKPREIVQLHFRAWPNDGASLYPQMLVPTLEKMLTFHTDDFPVVVHCSDGTGATGTAILCDICLRMASEEGCVDVPAMLEHLRNQRVDLVDNAAQYKLAHLVILNCLMGWKTRIPINHAFAKTIDGFFQNGSISSQLQYVRDCEWEDDGMKAASFSDDEMLMFPEKDRFSNIVPDKSARENLFADPSLGSCPSSTYINAVRVDAFCEPGRFIATQYPLPNTVGDFWRLVADKNVSVIICLNEFPINNNSFKMFLPDEVEEFSPESNIKVSHVRNENFEIYAILTYQIAVRRLYQALKPRRVKIIKFHGWKTTEDVPLSILDFITFVEAATNIARQSKPTLITCYTGATASGLFIAMSFLMEQVKREYACDVCLAVRTIRTSRKQFINTEEQLKFLYEALLMYVGEKFNEYSHINLLALPAGTAARS